MNIYFVNSTTPLSAGARHSSSQKQILEKILFVYRGCQFIVASTHAKIIGDLIRWRVFRFIENDLQLSDANCKQCPALAFWHFYISLLFITLESNYFITMHGRLPR